MSATEITPWQQIPLSFSDFSDSDKEKHSRKRQRTCSGEPKEQSLNSADSGNDTEVVELTVEDRVSELEWQILKYQKIYGTPGDSVELRDKHRSEIFGRTYRVVWSDAEALAAMKRAHNHAIEKARNSQQRSFADLSKIPLVVLKNATTHSSDWVNVTSAEGTRHANEDRFVSGKFSALDVRFFAVFDGHGGSEAAKFCRENLGKALLQRITYGPMGYKQKEKLTIAGIFNALKLTCVDLDQERYGDIKVGTTAIIAVIAMDRLWIANVGDSRAIITYSNGKYTPMSADADTKDPKYIKSAQRRSSLSNPVKKGRMGGVLGVARAIGSNWIQKHNVPTVIGRPKNTSIELSKIKGSRLVLVSDGVTCALSNSDISRLAFTKVEKLSPSETIVRAATSKESIDDITAMVIQL